jgi:hypothetical protein
MAATGIYAAVLTLFFVTLSVRVIMARRVADGGLGDGGSQLAVLKIVRS